MATAFNVRLSYYPRGSHLTTHDVLSLVPGLLESGLLVAFVRRTSVDITINEDAGPDMRHDFNTSFNKLVLDGAPYFTHTEERPDDMSTHIEALLIGTSVTIPIRNHRLNLGTWQGIYLCELCDEGDRHRLSITILEQFSRLSMSSDNGRNERHCLG